MAIQRQLDVMLNGGSGSAFTNATTNYPVNIGTTTTDGSTKDFTNITIGTPTKDFTNITIGTPTKGTNDEIFNLAEYILSLLSKSKISKISPESFFIDTKKLVLDVLETYRDELQDESSRIYELFHFLSTEMTDAKYLVLFMFFRGLGQGLFLVNDIFVYLDNNDLALTFENISTFLGNIKDTKKEIIKLRLEEESHEIFGNLFSFINKKYNDNSDTTFFHEQLETTEFMKDDADYLLSPVIDSLVLSLDVYRNLREAEEDYWLKTDNYNFTGVYTLERLKEIHSILSDRTYNDKVYGTPILMKKYSQKFQYLDNSDLNTLVVSILKNSFSRLTYGEVEKFIDEMCLDLVNYYLYETQLTFDYSDTSTQLPDLVGFARYKIDSINNTDLRKVTLEDIKRRKFYLNIISSYLGTTENDLETKDTLINSEFSLFRTEILDFRQYLINNGNFKEV